MNPPTARVAPQESFALTATVTGAADTTVSWSIREAPGGGVITPGGQYTAPGLNGTYHVVAVSNADPTKSAAATVTVAGDPPPTSGAPMTAAHRTSGVAPLLVFFDAVDATAGGVASPWAWTSGVAQPADLEGSTFAWDFGDPTAGVWTTTGRSRNRATGYTAAHVYETPGTYTAALTVTYTNGTTSTYLQNVTVGAFTGTTHYASAAGTGDGTSEASPSSYAAGITWLNGGPGRRLLLKRGDTFSVSGVTLGAAGPSILGAYGTGARPILNVSSGNGVAIGANDWRVMDLDVRSAGAGSYGTTISGTRSNALFLRVRTQGFATAGLHGGYNNEEDTPAFVECESTGAGVNGMYAGGHRLALLGNWSHDPVNEHVLRVWMAHKAVISNNRLEHTGGPSGSIRHVLKVEGRDTSSGLAQSRWMSVTDNVIDQGPVGAWAVSFGSQSGVAGEETIQNNLVFERNWIITGPEGDVAFHAETSHAVVRNNVFVMTQHGSGNTRAVLYEQRNSLVPAPSDVRIYNNTIYAGAAGTIYFLTTNATLTNARARNNIVAGPAVGLLDGAPGVGWIDDRNIVTTAAASSLFTNAGGGDFSLVPASAAVDAGLRIPDVVADYAGTARPLGAGFDVGAFESH